MSASVLEYTEFCVFLWSPLYIASWLCALNDSSGNTDHLKSAFKQNRYFYIFKPKKKKRFKFFEN